MLNVHIPPSEHPRIVVIGGGFAGIHFAKNMKGKPFQVILLDRNNFHQFQPLYYQVATSALEPDSIVFALRKIFRNQKNVVYRMANVEAINTAVNLLYTDIGEIQYDHLIIATGATNNFYGLKSVAENSMGFKTIQEALDIRSLILQNLESASNHIHPGLRDVYTNIVVVGGGPAGVEMAGAFAEFKKYIFEKDYPDLSPKLLKIYLIEAGQRLLPTMSYKSSKHAHKVLVKLGVNVILNAPVSNYDGSIIQFGTHQLVAASVIWTAGVKAQYPTGLGAAQKLAGDRLEVDQYHKVAGYENIYAIGDVAFMATPKYPKGHPQVAQTAIQQGRNLAKNLCRDPEKIKAFEYHNKGSLATIGKKRAVADLPGIHLKGFIGWFIWATVHLFSISGFKNKLRVGLNWMISYFSYDKRNRLIIRKYRKPTGD